MQKVYVLDTSVLLQDPECLWKFDDNELVIPAIVLEELDRQKKRQDEIGRNTRRVARHLDRLRSMGPLCQGIPLPAGGQLRIELNHRAWSNVGHQFLEMNEDNRILAVAYNLHLEEMGKSASDGRRPVILVSNDVLLRVKADMLGIQAEELRGSEALDQAGRRYRGYTELTVEPEVIDRAFKNRMLPTDILPGDWYPHQFLLLHSSRTHSQSAILRFHADKKCFIPVRGGDAHPWGLAPRNIQQRMAFELLMDDRVPLVTLTGPAGTGKTLLALAAGLQKVEEEQLYRKLLVSRPVVPLGNDLGFLPGDKDEKLRPWMQPIFDNLDFLLRDRKERRLEEVLYGLQHLEIEALTYIRGRSIPNQFVIVDEAQNLTPHEVRTIISRAGHGSKFVLLGDPQQIDHSYLNERNNGLTFAVERFKSEQVAGHIELIKGERSLLAEVAVAVLEESSDPNTKRKAYESGHATAI